MKSVIVIGAGVGGLAAAAVLARYGYEVIVLEAHVYPGGCAGTFYHKGYKFDAGATLAGGFYPGGPMDLLSKSVGTIEWPYQHADHIMDVHLPGDRNIQVWADDHQDVSISQPSGSHDTEFWDWQARTSDMMWDFALRLPPWPVQSSSQLFEVARLMTGWLIHHAHQLSPGIFLDSFRPIHSHLSKASIELRQFIDSQLLISAQTTSHYANALYGAAALDLPHRGVVHLRGGMGTIATQLVNAIMNNGGRVLFRQEVTGIQIHPHKPTCVITRRGGSYTTDIVLANLSPWNISRLVTGDLPRALRHLSPLPQDAWGAFTLYLGVDAGLLSSHKALHHQVVVSEPLGEGNSVFISISPEWDYERAPAGRRAITMSTHTNLRIWWELYEHDRAGYEEKKALYSQKLLNAAERALPGLAQSVDLMLPGTPVTFHRFTHRHLGWVGGFPQTNLFRMWAPRLSSRLWMVGDSIFPGQSTAAAALGGLRVAMSIMNEV